MHLFALLTLLSLFLDTKSQCCGGGGFNSNGCGSVHETTQFQITDPLQPRTNNWRRRALSRRVKRAKRSVGEEGSSCPMDFLQKAIQDGMVGNPSKSMHKIHSFLTYMDREDLGVVCSLDTIVFETYSHGFCHQKNNTTGENCLIFEV